MLVDNGLGVTASALILFILIFSIFFVIYGAGYRFFKQMRADVNQTSRPSDQM